MVHNSWHTVGAHYMFTASVALCRTGVIDNIMMIQRTFNQKGKARPLWLEPGRLPWPAGRFSGWSLPGPSHRTSALSPPSSAAATGPRDCGALEM